MDLIPEAFFEHINNAGSITRDPEQIAYYEKNTLGAVAKIGAVSYPTTKEEIQQLVVLANKYRVALYPISTGRNWGLGSAIPTTKRSVVVDLSRMNKVLDFDEQTGIITLQPGVTQGELRKFLDSKKAQFMSSITGAGPYTSILGNILDKGVGVLGSAIHTIRSIECILPNGNIYSDGINSLCGTQLSPSIRIGVGPLLEGLFIQCDFAIVTAITLTLYHQPKHISTFYISAPDKLALAKTIDIYHQYNTINGNGSLLCGRWSKALLPSKQEGGFSYSCIITSQDSSLHKVRKKMLKKLIKNSKLQYYSIDDKNINRLIKLFNYGFMQKYFKKLSPLVGLLDVALSYSRGYPNEHNLREQYELLQMETPTDRPLNLSQDGVGFIWYIVLFPATPSNLISFYEIVNASASAHHINDSRFHVLPYKPDVLVGIARTAFKLSNPIETEQANAFYLDILKRGFEKGFIPHRVPIPFINSLVNTNNPYWEFLKTIKNAVDPNNIICPDKYWSNSSGTN